MTVAMKVGALESTVTELDTVAGDIESARTACLQAIPDSLTTTSLGSYSSTVTVPRWLREQAADPITVILDLARLLDEDGNGQSSWSNPDGEAMDDIREHLGVVIATGLANVGPNDRAGMERYSEYMARYGDNEDVMGSILEELGPDGTEEVLNNAEALEVDIAPSFGEVGQQIIADWVSEDIENLDVDSQTTTFLENFHDQEPFSTQLFTETTPDEFGDVIQHMSDYIYPANNTYPYDPLDGQIYQDFLTYAGSSLATYSSSVSSPSGLAQEWSDAITGNGTDVLEEHPNPENAGALTLLIREGGQIAEFDERFLGDLTNSVYDWERSFDGAPVWGPLDQLLGEGRGIKSPEMIYNDTTTAEDNQTVYTDAHDGLANLLGGMEKSPAAAERFFTYESDGTYVDQVDYNDQQVNEKLLYLFRDRVWPTDDGDGFGVALQHAATYARDEGDGSDSSLSRGDRAARLASQSVFIIGRETGRDDGLFDDGWQIPAGMRDNVGYMLSAYAPDINRISQADGDVTADNNWVFGDGQGEDAYHGIMGLSASNSDLAVALQGIGRGDNKDGITAVLTAQVAHHENLIDDAVAAYNEAHPNAPKTIDELKNDHTFMEDLSQAGASNGQALEFVLSNGVAGGTDDQDARAERRKMLATAFSIGTSFLPGPAEVLGDGASELARDTYGVVTSTAIGELKNRIGAAPEDVTAQWGGDSEEMIRDGLSYGTYNSLLNAGYLDPDVDPEYGIPASVLAPPDESGRISIDPSLYDGVIDEDDDPTASADFNTWLQTEAPRSMVETMLNGYSNKVNSWIAN